MRFLGLFVGVDDQVDRRIPRLPFAGRDAEALAAVFGDTYVEEMHGTDRTVLSVGEASDGPHGDIICLLGRDATATAVREALAHLAARSQERAYDLAVVHFSCHGTPAGDLLLADAERGDASVGHVPMDLLEALLQQVVVSHMVVTFDTCFSGVAAGSQTHLRESRDADALHRRLGALTRGNRAVVAAATADQHAHEIGRLGHGILSYAMLSAFEESSLRRPDGRVSIIRWLHEAVSRAVAEVAREGLTQNPVQNVNWTDDPTMLAPRPGRTNAIRARRARFPITHDVASLEAYGIPASIRDAIRELIRGERFVTLQVRAVNDGGVMAGDNVVVAAPTSAGKTLIGYLAAIAATRRRGRAVILLPTRALTNEKWAEFRDIFGSRLGADGLRAVRSFGGVEDDDQAIRSNHYDVAFLTYEKFLLLILAWPRLLDAVTTVVLDEVHLLSDPARGRTVELLLTHLRRRATLGANTQLVALSAALGTLNGFPEWLDAHLIEEAESERPVPIKEGVVSPSGRVRFRDSATGTESVARLFPSITPRQPEERTDALLGRVALRAGQALLADDAEQRLLAFRLNRANTRNLAREFAETLALARCDSPLEALHTNASAREDTLAGSELAERLEHGVAFHISDLEQPEREAIEAAFRARELKVMVATSGLAVGVNTPATAVLVVDHTGFDGEEYTFSVTDVKNMAGRAGRMLPRARPGMSLICAPDDREADRLFATYVLGKAEPLTSQLSKLEADDLALALLVLTGRTKEGPFLDVARGTFDGFLSDLDTAWRSAQRLRLRAAVEQLVQDGFVFRHPDASFEPTQAGCVLGRTGVSVASARRVVAATRQLVAANEPLDEIALVALAQLTDEMQQAGYIPAHASEEPKWAKIVATKILPGRPTTVALLRDATFPDGSLDRKLCAMRLKRTFAIVQWIFQAPLRQIEELMFAFLRRSPEPAASMVRGTASRTGSVLRTLAKVLALQLPELAPKLSTCAVTLIPCLEHGVGREAIGLAKYRLGLSGKQLLALHQHGLASYEDLLHALKQQQSAVMTLFGSSGASELLVRMEQHAPMAESLREEDEAEQYALFDAAAHVQPWTSVEAT